MTVDGARAAEEPPAGGGRGVEVDSGAGGRRARRSRRPVRGRLRGRDLLVVDKPAGVVTHPAPGHRGPTLAEALAAAAGGPDPERPGIVHRLDRDTSGLMSWPRPAAHAALAAQLRAREIAARVPGARGGPPGRRERDHRRPDRARPRPPHVVSTRTDRPRSAVTHFEVLERLPRHHAAAGAAGDRAHPPDPRAPGRDRPSGVRRPAVRGHSAAVAGLDLERQFLHAATTHV